MAPQSSTPESTPSGRGPLAAGPSDFCMEWNAENQLTRVLTNGTEVARYKYDPKDRRVERVAGGTTTPWAYDAEDIIRETVGGTATKYVHGPGIDEPLAQEDGSGVLSHIHADGLGSVVRASDGSGTVISSRRYYAFGSLEVGATNGYAFTRREWDAAAGLAYHRARYYDPRLGRFITEDPVRFMGGVNFYSYVKGDPINTVDPLGWMGWGLVSPSCELYWGLYAKKLGDQDGWPYAHCMASCLIKSNCGQPQAVVAGFSKELFDTVACVFTLKNGSCTSAFQPSDFDDNFHGATCSNNMSCWDCCASLKGVPDRPGGPLSCLGVWGK